MTEAARAPVPKSALCQAHERAAEALCPRCGDFLCGDCLVNDEPLCPACRLRRSGRYPFSRENWSLGALIKDAVNSYQREIGSLIVSALTLTVLFWTVSFAALLSVFAFFDFGKALPPGERERHMIRVLPAVYAFGGLLILILCRAGLDAARRRRIEAGRLLGVLRSLPRIIAHAVVLLIALGLLWVITVGLVVLLALGLRAVLGALEGPVLIAWTLAYALSFGVLAYFAAGLMFAPLELLHNPAAGPVRSVINAFKIARGYRLTVLGLACLLFLCLYLSYGLSLVGGFAVLPAFHILHANIFLALRNGSGLPPVKDTR